ncbi:MAG: hypothetical protein AAF968_03395, partial [Pseudomonadota bacterium]
PFEFINPRSAVVIFQGVMKKVFRAIKEEHDVDVRLTEEAENRLLELCTFELNDGGRGIGNRIESNFINPIATVLFENEGARELVISGIEIEDKDPRLILQGEEDDTQATGTAA